MDTFKQEVKKLLVKHTRKSYVCCDETCFCWDIANLITLEDDKSFQQSVQLTALRHGLAMSIFINVVLLAVALYAIGGN